MLLPKWVIVVLLNCLHVGALCAVPYKLLSPWPGVKDCGCLCETGKARWDSGMKVGTARLWWAQGSWEPGENTAHRKGAPLLAESQQSRGPSSLLHTGGCLSGLAGGLERCRPAKGKKQLWPTLHLPQTAPAHHYPRVLLPAHEEFKWNSKARSLPVGKQRCTLTTPDYRKKHRLVRKQNSSKKSERRERCAWGLGETGTKLPMSGYRVTCWGSGNSFAIKDKFEHTGSVHCNYPTQSRLPDVCLMVWD